VIGIIIAFAAWLLVNTLIATLGFKIPWTNFTGQWFDFPTNCVSTFAEPGTTPPPSGGAFACKNSQTDSCAGKFFTADCDGCAAGFTCVPESECAPQVIVILPAADLIEQMESQGVVFAPAGGSLSCGGVGALDNRNELERGDLLTTCSTGCSTSGAACTPGATILNPNVLPTLEQVSVSQDFTVTSIATGDHTSANSAHYSGDAVDIIPNGSSTNSSLVQQIEIACGGPTQCNATDKGNHVHVEFF